MRCPYCSNEVEEQNHFCRKCGLAITDSSVHQALQDSRAAAKSSVILKVTVLAFFLYGGLRFFLAAVAMLLLQANVAHGFFSAESARIVVLISIIFLIVSILLFAAGGLLLGAKKTGAVIGVASLTLVLLVAFAELITGLIGLSADAGADILANVIILGLAFASWRSLQHQ